MRVRSMYRGRASAVGRAIVAVAAVSTLLLGRADGQPPKAPPAPPVSSQSVVDSPEWMATRQAFQQWLSVQQIYSDAEMQKMVNDLRLRVANMSESERVAFMKDMQSRLAVLNSEQAQQARAWMGETMSRLTPAGQQKLRQQIPDVSNMSAAELQQALAANQKRIQARQRNSATSAQIRSQQNQLAMQMNQQRQQAFNDARVRQQNAVSNQATNRRQQAFQQSQQNARENTMIAPSYNAPLFNPYVWANPWVW